MWQEGQEDLFDDVSESFIRCALHQGVIFYFIIIQFEIYF
jgi:hypothetical protein